MKVNEKIWIVYVCAVLILIGGGFWGGYRVCTLRKVLPLEAAIERAEKASEILAAHIVAEAQQTAEEAKVKIEGMDAHDVTITFLDADALSELADTADGITARAARAVVKYLRSNGIDFVTVHRRGIRGGGESRGP